MVKSLYSHRRGPYIFKIVSECTKKFALDNIPIDFVIQTISPNPSRDNAVTVKSDRYIYGNAERDLGTKITSIIKHQKKIMCGFNKNKGQHVSHTKVSVTHIEGCEGEQRVARYLASFYYRSERLAMRCDSLYMQLSIVQPLWTVNDGVTEPFRSLNFSVW